MINTDFCMLYVFYTVFLQSSKLKKRKCYYKNHKKEKIHLRYLHGEKNPHVSGPAQFKPVVQESSVFITYKVEENEYPEHIGEPQINRRKINNLIEKCIYEKAI